MRAVALALAFGASLLGASACKKKDAEPAPQPRVERMPAPEMQRSQDACKQYVDRICACATTVPAVAKQCELSRALPEAVRIGLEIAQHPDTKPADVSQSLNSVRKTAKECIEQLGKLPSLGCP